MQDENIEIVVREVPCAKETLELGEGVAGMVEDVRAALADGWQPGEDIPAILASAVSRLGAAVDGASKIPGEFGNKQAFLNGVMVPISQTVGSLLDK